MGWRDACFVFKKMVKKNLLKKRGEWKWVFSGYFLDKNQRGLPLVLFIHLDGFSRA